MLMDEVETIKVKNTRQIQPISIINQKGRKNMKNKLDEPVTSRIKVLPWLVFKYQ